VGPSLVAALILAWAPTQAPEVCCGRVLDPRGDALVGVDLALLDEPAEVLATTGADGTFELDLDHLPPMRRLGIARSQAVTTVVAALRGLCGQSGEYLIVGAPKARLRGRVHDIQGNALGGVELSAEVDPELFLLAFPRPLDAYSFVGERTASDDQGSFELDAPAVDGLTLLATAQGYGTHRERLSPLALQPLADIVLELGRVSACWEGRAPLHGRVLKQNGEPAAGALVVWGTHQTHADTDGSFSIGRPQGLRTDDTLCAVLPGLQPALVPDPAGALALFGSTEEPVILTLGGPALSISGRVFDELGNPCAAWYVELVEGTGLSPENRPQLIAERLVAGRNWEEPIVTQADGSFRIDGLLPRTYVLEAWDHWPADSDWITIRSGAIEAGSSGIELRLERDAWIDDLAGRFVDLEGKPQADLEVALDIELPLEWMVPGGELDSRYTRTDAEGHFRLGRVPRDWAALQINAPDLASGLRLPISASGPEQGWTYLLPRGPNLRLEWVRAGPLPDSLEILDAQGEPLAVYIFLAGRAHSRAERVHLRGAASLLLAVSPDARCVSLRRGDEVVERRPLTVEPHGLTRVRIE